DGAKGMAHIAQRTMREAFARFCREQSDQELRRGVRDLTARQWMAGARAFSSVGQLAEASRFAVRAAWWSPKALVYLATTRAAHSLSAALRRSTPVRFAGRVLNWRRRS